MVIVTTTAATTKKMRIIIIILTTKRRRARSDQTVSTELYLVPWHTLYARCINCRQYYGIAGPCKELCDGPIQVLV